MPNIGLAYLISSVERKHAVRLIDTTFHVKDYKEYILKKIDGFHPDVVGFSTTTFNFQNSLKIARFIKEAIPDPDVRFIWGGVHPTLVAEETLAESAVDAICIGEGEVSFLAYLDKIETRQQPHGVEGIWFKDEQKNIVKNRLRPFIQDLDSLPFPDWDYFETDKYLEFSRRGFMFLASRGCPFSCTFCSSPSVGRLIPGKYYRTRSPESVFNEIKAFQEKYSNGKFEHIYFGDETFGLDAQQFKGICGLLQRDEELENTTWSCETRADIVTEEWARTASESGCTLVILGIESADEYIRNQVYKKNISDEEIQNAIQNLRKYNIGFIFLILLGSYKETEASIRRNFEFLKREEPSLFYVVPYCPTPGTELYEMTKDAAERPRKGVGLKLQKFRMLKITLFIKYGFRKRGINFIADLFYIFLTWIFSVRKTRLNKEYLIASIEKNTTLTYMHKKRSSGGKKLNPREYDNHEYTLS